MNHPNGEKLYYKGYGLKIDNVHIYIDLHAHSRGFEFTATSRNGTTRDDMDNEDENDKDDTNDGNLV